MVVLRRVIGDALRSRRLDQDRTLRDVSTAANVSLGYLSEIERGQKEASSELLASICEALDVRLSEVLREASGTLALAEEMVDMMQPTTADPGPADATAEEGAGEAPGGAAARPATQPPVARAPQAKLSTAIELSIKPPTGSRRPDVVCAA